jgi:hypothetical protein
MEAAFRDENNYCASVTARQLTRIKYRILLVFYATSLAVRPWRGFQLLWNVMRERESCKLDTFLIARKRRFREILRGRASRSAAAADGEAL